MTDYDSTVCPPYQPTDEKDPDAIDNFVFNWVVQLDGDTISTSSFLLPDGLTSVTTSNTTTTATIRVSGGTASSIYRITNRVVTAASRTLDKTKYVLVREQ